MLFVKWPQDKGEQNELGRGRMATELTQCYRCGAFVKYPIEYLGKSYGSTCISRITGHPFNWAAVYDRVYDPDRLIRESAESSLNSYLRELESRKKYFSTENNWLINVLRDQSGDFCASMIQHLESDSILDLSDKCLRILADIYAKSHGRRNSKAYEKAYDEFWDIIEKAER